MMPNGRNLWRYLVKKEVLMATPQILVLEKLLLPCQEQVPILQTGRPLGDPCFHSTGLEISSHRVELFSRYS